MNKPVPASPAQPESGTFWTHSNGNVYEVLMLTNESSEREEYQPQIVYRGGNGKVWSRPIADWSRSFTKGGLRPLRECPDCGLGMADSHVCKAKPNYTNRFLYLTAKNVLTAFREGRNPTLDNLDRLEAAVDEYEFKNPEASHETK